MHVSGHILNACGLWLTAVSKQSFSVCQKFAWSSKHQAPRRQRNKNTIRTGALAEFMLFVRKAVALKRTPFARHDPPCFGASSNGRATGSNDDIQSLEIAN
jgi:hypothetical protein